jgi:hypothetical protein
LGGILLSSRVSFAFAVGFLLLAAIFRLWDMSALPPGLHDEEVTDIRVAETARRGGIEVFYDLSGGADREGLYHMALAAVTSLTGRGLIGYHLFSVWSSLLALALTYALATRLFGPLAGAAALGLLAVNLSNALLARSIARETLLPLLVTGVLLVTARAFTIYRQHRPHMPPTAPFVILGVLLGIGFYIHPAHFLITLFTMVFIAVMVIQRRQMGRQAFGYLGFSLLVMIIFAMPYLISSLRLPELSGASRLFAGYNAFAQPLLQVIGSGIAGIFFAGDRSPIHNLPGRPLLDLVSGVLLLLGLLVAARGWRQPRYLLLLLALLALAAVALFTPVTPDFSAISGLLPVLALCFGLGVSALYASLTGRSRQVFTVGLLALLAFNVLWAGRDLFVVRPARDDVQTAYHSDLGRLARYLDQTAEQIPTLICDDKSLAAGQISRTDLLLVMMNRKSAPLRLADCTTSLIFINGGEGQQIVFPTPTPQTALHPYIRAWLRRGIPAPGAPQGVTTLTVADTLADTIGRFTTTAPVAFAPEAPGQTNLTAPPVRFGGNLSFLGYEKQPAEPYPAGSIVTSITYWRADGQIAPSLRLFTHILLDPASIAAQTDTISVDVGSLRSRDVFVQVTYIPLPPSMPAGDYGLSIGAYDALNNLRMTVLDNEAQRGTRLFIGQVAVTQPGR